MNGRLREMCMRDRGILTQAYYLAAHGNHGQNKNVIFRGKVIFERMFCDKMPPPPDDAAAANGDTSDRSLAPACRSCHAIVDPIGRIFDIYDDTGRERASSDVDGYLGMDVDIGGPYQNAVEFSSALGQSQAMAQCFSRQLYRFALGRDPKALELASFESVFNVVRADSSIGDALKALTLTPSFSTLHVKSNTASCQGNF